MRSTSVLFFFLFCLECKGINRINAKARYKSLEECENKRREIESRTGAK